VKNKEESGRFFEKKLRKKLLIVFTPDVSTSPDGEEQKFLGGFFQKSDRFLNSFQ
jgi:hypothetical protein